MIVEKETESKQITLKENKLLLLCQAFSILTILFDDVKIQDLT